MKLTPEQKQPIYLKIGVPQESTTKLYKMATLYDSTSHDSWQYNIDLSCDEDYVFPESPTPNGPIMEIVSLSTGKCFFYLIVF